MTPLKKFLIITISLIVLWFFLVLTFFIAPQKTMNNLVFPKKEKIGITYFWTKNKLKKEKINILDDIYSSRQTENNYTIKEKNIILKTWLYFFDFKNWNKTYNIISENFKINTLGLWKIFINNSDKNSIIIYNFDNVINLDFINKKNEKINSIKLFPHNLVIFSENTTKSKSLKWANFARIKDFILVKYINNSYLTRTKDKLEIKQDFFQELEEIFSKTVFVKKAKKINPNFIKNTKEFLSEIFSKIILEEEKNSISCNKLKNIKIWNIKINKYLKEYPYLSFNEKKVNTYKQNSILEKIHNSFLYENKNHDKQIKKKEKQKLNKIIENIKKSNKKNSNKLNKIIENYYIILAENNNIKRIENKKNFAFLLENIWLKEYQNNYKNNYFDDFKKLNSIYYSYDLEKNNENNENSKNILIQNFNDFSQIFYKKINILEEKNTDNKNKILDFYSTFLFNFLKNNLNFEEKNIKSYNDLLETYNNIEIIEADKILENIELLEKIDKITRMTFFEEKRNKDKKLILNLEWKKLKNKKFLEEFKRTYKNINKIYSFINQNLNLIQNNEIYTKKLVNFSNHFEEYNDAINSTTQYLQKSKSSDLKNSIVKEKNKKQENDINNIKKYLNNFVNLKITTKTKINFEKNYFNINNLKLWFNKKISFKIYPKESNFIDSIRIVENNIEKNIKTTFFLDDIKKEWDQKNKNNSNKTNKTKYDFKYFFINTFDKLKTPKKITKISENDEYIETWKIIKLKRWRLLWEEKWELSNLKDFMKVDYNKIFVYEKENWDFNIKLKEIPFFIQIKSGNSMRTKNWIFSSNYILDDNETFFSNIKVKLLHNNKISLNWTEISIIWSIKYFSAKEKFKKIIKKSEQINFIYNSIYSILKIKNVKINYFLNSDSITFGLEYKKNWLDKNIRIKTKWDKIISIERNMENILWWDIIDYKELKYSLEALK